MLLVFLVLGYLNREPQDPQNIKAAINQHPHNNHNSGGPPMGGAHWRPENIEIMHTCQINC